MNNAGPTGEGKSLSDSERRRFGVYYTPISIARLMVSCCSGLGSWLDPACGEGVFLEAILERLVRDKPQETSIWEVVRNSLFGRDRDHSAVRIARERIRNLLPPDPDGNRILEDNIQVGDFLGETPIPPKIEIVIGNPPYRRERDSKTDRSAWFQSAWLAPWRSSRMDLWQAFAHRGLDLLSEGGTLCYIIPDYWRRGESGRKLVERIQTSCTINDLYLLGSSPLFPKVAGRHMILRLTKGTSPDLCTVHHPPVGVSLVSSITESDWTCEQFSQEQAFGKYFSTPSESQGTYRNSKVTKKNRESPLNSHCKQELQTSRLGDYFLVRQGIAENPPYVTKRMAQMIPGVQPGGGVFVLSESEVEQIRKTRILQWLRPYYSPAEIGPYYLPRQPKKWLLYLTRETAPELPEILRPHLERFRGVLELRREVQKGSIRWWHLHWPREERLFLNPRILMPQMNQVPCCVWVEYPAFIGFSTHVILAADSQNQNHPDSSLRITLPLLAGILNSDWATRWFRENAKERGIGLDITGSLLRQFPLPMNPAPPDRLEELIESVSKNSPPPTQLIEDISELVIEWYESGKR